MPRPFIVGRRASGLLLALRVVAITLAARPSDGGANGAPVAQKDASIAAYLAGLAAQEPMAKVEGRLRAVARQASPERHEYIVILSARELRLADRADFVHHFTWPAGEHVTIAHVPASEILSIAAMPGVYAVSSGDPDAQTAPPFPPSAADRALDKADFPALRARLDAAPGWSEFYESWLYTGGDG